MELRNVFLRIDSIDIKGGDKILLFGVGLDGQEVVGKVMWGTSSKELPGLMYEASVYKKLVNPMVNQYNESINMVTMYAWLPKMPAMEFYSQLHEVAPIEEVHKVLNVVKRMVSIYMWILVTNVPDNLIGSAIEVLDNYPQFATQALFQMMYTIRSCTNRGLIHNDLHMGNWLVSMPGKRVVYALTSEMGYMDPGNVMVYLYDWDRAYHKLLGENPLLKVGNGLCLPYGQCNSDKPGRDMGQTVCEWATTVMDVDTLCDKDGVQYGPDVYPFWARGPMCKNIASGRDQHLCITNHDQIPCTYIGNMFPTLLKMPGVKENLVNFNDPKIARQILNDDVDFVVLGGMDSNTIERTLKGAIKTTLPVQIQMPVGLASRRILSESSQSSDPMSVGSGASYSVNTLPLEMSRST